VAGRATQTHDEEPSPCSGLCLVGTPPRKCSASTLTHALPSEHTPRVVWRMILKSLSLSHLFALPVQGTLRHAQQSPATRSQVTRPPPPIRILLKKRERKAPENGEKSNSHHHHHYKGGTTRAAVRRKRAARQRSHPRGRRPLPPSRPPGGTCRPTPSPLPAPL